MITVFTPTYNRAYILPQLYDSLKRQTLKAFEWIVVDDGSTDGTSELFNRWRNEENGFKIRYHVKENGGKHTAINLGVSIAAYPWFFIVDSDDYLTDDAIEKAEDWIALISDEKIAGVSGMRISADGKTIGEEPLFPENGYVDAMNTDRKRYGLDGDKAEIYRTEILRKFPFPVFKGEKFLSEICVWNEISNHGYPVRWYNYPLIVCEYLDDGLSFQVRNNDLMLNNLQGYLYCMKYYLMSCRGTDRLRKVYRYSCDARKKGYTYKELSELSEIRYTAILLAVGLGNVKKAIGCVREVLRHKIDKN